MTDRYYEIGKHRYMQYADDRLAEFVFSQIPQHFFISYHKAIELGAGMGRFSAPLAEKFPSLTLVEPCLSYADALSQTFTSRGVRVMAMGAEEALPQLETNPVALFAFHLLHHIDLEKRLMIHRFVTLSGSVGIIVEPNPFNPLIVMQILLNPDMSFWEERRYFKLTLKRHRKEIESVGGEVLHAKTFCFLPPFVLNYLIPKISKERLLRTESMNRILPWLCSYQLIIYRHAT